MSDSGNMMLSLIMTVAIYGAGPCLFVRFRKEKIIGPHFSIFCVLYTLVVFLFCDLPLCNIFLEIILPLLLGAIFYFACRKRLIARSILLLPDGYPVSKAQEAMGPVQTESAPDQAEAQDEADTEAQPLGK